MNFNFLTSIPKSYAWVLTRERTYTVYCCRQVDLKKDDFRISVCGIHQASLYSILACVSLISRVWASNCTITNDMLCWHTNKLSFFIVCLFVCFVCLFVCLFWFLFLFWLFFRRKCYPGSLMGLLANIDRLCPGVHFSFFVEFSGEGCDFVSWVCVFLMAQTHQ